MRELYVEDVEGTYEGCCAISVIHGFYAIESRKPVTDDEWYLMLSCEDSYDEKLVPRGLGHMVSFAHASSQTGVFNPKKFAEWLICKGEEVVEGPTVRNRPRHTITPYFWVPSKKFNRSLKQFCDRLNKNKKEEIKKHADYDRGLFAT